MKLIVGLGNPGKKYEKTRHNVGFMVVNAWAKNYSVKFSTKVKFKGELAQVSIGNETVIILKPTTYMNLSGESVQQVQNFYNIDEKDILVIYDDLDLACGKLRVRQKGSAGGHNGIKSLIQTVGLEFHRLRIGIGRDPIIPTVDYVLGKFTPEQKTLINDAIIEGMNVIDDWIDNDIISVMNKYN